MRALLSKASLFVLLVVTIPSARGQGVAVKKMALMSFTGSVEVKATPLQIWPALTEPAKAKLWYPGWKNTVETQNLSAVGQSLGFVDEWANAGKSIVLFVNKNKELRMAHMPNDGSYVCQVKFKLEPKGTGTLVTIIDQYSDEADVPLDRDTAAQVKAGMAKYLTDLKMVVEAKK